jgi:beta-glucosidase
MSTADRIDALIATMTLEEKLGQMTMTTAGMAETGPAASADLTAEIGAGRCGWVFNLWGADRVAALQRVAVEQTRLGVPLAFGLDVLHGHRTIFPTPLAEAGAFDPGLWRATARVAAQEAAEDGIDLTFAPMLDVCRDPRWGRIAEGPGEDPWIGARWAEAQVAGFGAARLDAPDAVAACAKHLGAYGAVAGGRDYASADVSDRTLEEVYWPPFRAAVAAGAAAIMPAFVDLAGVPMTANAAVLRGALRDRWGFHGVVISDYGAVAEMVAHGVAADLADAAALALRAGVDVDMMGFAYIRGLPQALADGRAAIADVDAAVRRVLSLKAALGLLDDPFRRTRAAAPSAPERSRRRALAREAARASITLLKNDGPLLPLAPAVRRLAVLGPLAGSADDMLGPWSCAGAAADAVSPLDGLRAAAPGLEIVHAKGCETEGGGDEGFAEAVAAAAGADAVVLCLGESRWQSGEAASRGRLDLPGRQADLARAVCAAGRPVALVLASGRPLCVGDLIDRADAALAIGFPGVEGGAALADILLGRAGPGGRLAVSWPVDVGQIPVFAGRRPTGRPLDPENKFTTRYLDLPNTPLFPLGHGLSYGRVVWRSLAVEPAILPPDGVAEVVVTLSNEGDAAAEEVVFLFARPRVASTARPVLSLIGFEKVRLSPGETLRVPIAIPADALATPEPDGARRLEPGLFDIMAGPSAEEGRLSHAVLRVAGRGLS